MLDRGTKGAPGKCGLPETRPRHSQTGANRGLCKRSGPPISEIILHHSCRYGKDRVLVTWRLRPVNGTTLVMDRRGA